MNPLRKLAAALMLTASLCACAPGGLSGSAAPPPDSSLSGTTSGPENSALQDGIPERLPSPTPEAFGLEGAQGELFQAMADQDGGSWSLTIPRVAIRGVKELSPLQTTYFCTVQAAHYDVRGDRIVDSGSTSYRAVVTLKHDKDQTQFTWIAFSTVEEGETLSTLRNLGMNTLADQLEAGDPMEVVWQMADGDTLLTEYCASVGRSLTWETDPQRPAPPEPLQTCVNFFLTGARRLWYHSAYI